jgi:hypothetical protein
VATLRMMCKATRFAAAGFVNRDVPAKREKAADGLGRPGEPHTARGARCSLRLSHVATHSLTPVFMHAGGDRYRHPVSPLLNSAPRRVLGDFTLTQVLRDDRPALMARVRSQLDTEAQTFGIVRISRANLPTDSIAREGLDNEALLVGGDHFLGCVPGRECGCRRRSRCR